MKTSQKTINKYMEMVSTVGRVWTEGEIISFRSLLNMKLRDQPDVKAALINKFNESLEVAPFQLTMEQQAKGLQWLLKTQVNKKGELRQAQTTFINETQLSMLKDFSRFEFTGLYDISSVHQHYAGWSQFVAEYRLLDSKERSFSYGPDYGGGFRINDVVTAPFKSVKLKAV